jgi:hypothetical protein
MLIFDYSSKKELKASIGKQLHYLETSLFGPEYRSTGTLTGANRPHITNKGREFFATVVMRDGLIEKVS